MTVVPAQGPTLFIWPEAIELGASVAVTQRHGGVSEGPYDSLNLGLHVGDDSARVLANRDTAADTFGVSLAHVVFAEQVHGADVAFVGPPDAGRGSRSMDDAIPSTDILVTTSAEVALIMLVADCVPLALIDPEARVMAVVHAGWRGTAAGAVARALGAMAEAGGRTDRVVAFMGPAVQADRYQVDDVVHRALTGAIAPHPLEPHVAVRQDPGHWHVDLIAANRQQLVLAGVPPAQIFDSGTSTADDDYFSDRAARPCGRFGLLAQLRT